MTELGASTWPEAAGWAADRLLAVPLGATEQHGPHLPLATDTVVAEALARGLASCRGDVTVAPALPYGASGEHADFPGTLSVGTEATAHLLVELVRSADAFRGVVLVCAHGGNADALALAGRQLDADGRVVVVWIPPATLPAGVAAEGRADAHAGWVETSLLLALAPSLVRPDRQAAGALRPLGELADRLRRHGVRSVSPNGVLGDPAGASADAGRALLQAWVADLADAVAARWGPAAGRDGTAGARDQHRPDSGHDASGPAARP